MLTVSHLLGGGKQGFPGPLWFKGVKIRISKHEVRNKSEFQMLKIPNLQHEGTRLGHLRFEFRSLFRIGQKQTLRPTFGFRIFAPLCHVMSPGPGKLTYG